MLPDDTRLDAGHQTLHASTRTIGSPTLQLNAFRWCEESGESISRRFVWRHLADIGGPDRPAENRLRRRLRSRPRLL